MAQTTLARVLEDIKTLELTSFKKWSVLCGA